MTFFIAIVIIIFILFVIGVSTKEDNVNSNIKYPINGKNMQNKKNDDEKVIGFSLATLTLKLLEQDNISWKTPEEKKEVLCFLIYITNLCIDAKFLGNSERALIIKGSFLIAIATQKNTYLSGLVLKDIDSRLALYKKCPLFTNGEGFSTPGTSSLILNHFLKIAKGNTTEKDVTNILLGKAKIEENDLDQFLDPSENFALIMSVSSLFITIKKFLDELCKKFNM